MEYLQGGNVKKKYVRYLYLRYFNYRYNISPLVQLFRFSSIYSFSLRFFFFFFFFTLLFILRKMSAFNILPWISAIFMVVISRSAPWIWHSMDLRIKQRMRMYITLIVLVFPVCYRSVGDKSNQVKEEQVFECQ